MRVFVFGEPSIDHIVTADKTAQSYIDEDSEVWRLPDEAFFFFRNGRNITRLDAGRKWSDVSEPLPLYDKVTLSPNDRGYVSTLPYTEALWHELLEHPHAILGNNYRCQSGGPARNSLDAMVDAEEIFPNGTGTDYTLFFLMGDDSATAWFLSHLDELNEGHKGTISTHQLTDERWATHEAFNIILPNGRSLIRYQEHMQEFNPEYIKKWFEHNADQVLTSDVIVVNSLKHPLVIEHIAQLLPQFSGKKIVAPTGDMLDKNYSETMSMLQYADVVACNMREVEQMLRLPHQHGAHSRENLLKSLYNNHIRSGRLYVSDGEHPSWVMNNAQGPCRYQLQNFPIYNPINAGDIWTGILLYHEIHNGHDAMEVLKHASDYASLHVALPKGNAITKEAYTNFSKLSSDVQ